MIPPSISVVVPTRDRGDLLATCLAALRSTLRAQDELVVVDSASGTPVVAELAQEFAARTVRVENQGASRARNAGWRICHSGVVAFIDDDCFVTPEWRDAIVSSFADPGIGFVIGRVVVPADQELTDSAVSVLPSKEPRVISTSTELLGGSGNFAVRTEVLRAVGGFDERLGPGTAIGSAEDVDLVDRLLALGVVGRFDPRAVVGHRQWRAGRELLRVHWYYGKGAGARLAKALLSDRRRARELVPGVLRLGGVRTVMNEVRAGRPRNRLPGVVWRLGAVAGVVSGLRRLRPPDWPAPR